MDASDVVVQARVDGELRQDGRTSLLLHDIPAVIEWVTAFMSIEWGARAGMIAPDATTYAYLQGRPHAPADWDEAVAAATCGETRWVRPPRP